jgi:hypothetical protein
MKKIIKLLCLLALSLLLIVFSFEMVFKTFFPERIVPDLHQARYNLPAVLRPNLDVRLDWSHGYLYPPFRLQTNSKSFLGEQEFQYEKPKNVFRILMLGNSIFMGLGVENSELFSKNLEEILNQKSHNKKIEVINFSGVAWSAIQFYAFLQTEGYKYKPDLVIISQGENDFRVEYNNLIEINKVEKEKLPNGNIKINLQEQKINSKINNPLSITWEWIRKLPFYLEVSKGSQALYRIRSKVNDLWYKKTPQIPRSKKLGYFLETNNIELTKESLIALNSDEFSIHPERHSILFYAKAYKSNLYDAKANIALHSAMQVKISQFLNSLGGDFVVADIPSWQETLGTIDSIGTRRVNSSLKNYFYLNPTKEFIKFQSDNIETPLYYF